MNLMRRFNVSIITNNNICCDFFIPLHYLHIVVNPPNWMSYRSQICGIPYSLIGDTRNMYLALKYPTSFAIEWPELRSCYTMCTDEVVFKASDHASFRPPYRINLYNYTRIVTISALVQRWKFSSANNIVRYTNFVKHTSAVFVSFGGCVSGHNSSCR